LKTGAILTAASGGGQEAPIAWDNKEQPYVCYKTTIIPFLRIRK
jgi:hypothetical protein